MRASRRRRGLERVRELRNGGEPVRRHLLERPQDRLLDRRRHAAPHRAQRRHGIAQVARQNRLGRGSRERRAPGEHLVRHAAKAIDVAAAVEPGRATRLLGAHVAGRPDRQPRLRQLVFARGGKRPRDAEIGDHRLIVGQQDVRGLDIAVHHAVAVGVVERFGHLARDPERLVQAQLLLTLQPLAQRLAGDERHDIIKEPAGLARVVQRQDVGVLQLGREPDLPQEPLDPDRARYFRVDHLDGGCAIVLQVVREVHGRHPATAELALDYIVAGEGSLQARQSVGQEEGPGGG